MESKVRSIEGRPLMPSSRVALVTGSGRRRIGWHVADALAGRGYALAIHYRTAAAEAAETVAQLKSRGVEAGAFPADLTDEQAVRSLVQQTLAQFGRLDVLVNCAAVWQRKRLEAITAADVRHHFETNTLGTFLCCQQAGLAMTRQPEGGCIINLGDWAVVRPYVNYAAYFPSKGAIPTLTRTLAVELATRNPRVRVNCILPGPVMLPLDLPPTERQQAIDATLVKHEGRPEHIAQAVLFFIDNDFVTGACLPVDGGRTVFAPDALVRLSSLTCGVRLESLTYGTATGSRIMSREGFDCSPTNGEEC
jgi:pteridine reductase